MPILDVRIVSINPAGFVTPQFADPNIQFIDAECSCPPQFIPCTWNDQTFLKITNNGAASDQCQLGVMITGHTSPGQFIQIGDPFSMGAGESKNAQISIHFDEDYWTQTEDIELIFVVGFWINETQIQVTDSIPFNTQVYVPDITCSDYTNQIDCVNAQCYWWSDGTCHSTQENGNGVKCEDYASEPTCKAAGCFWYKKYLWEEEKCHTAEQNMMMDYLPFIIAGVGGAIIIVALVTRAPAPAPHYPPPRYPYPPRAY